MEGPLKDSSFHPDWTKNMVTIVSDGVKLKKSSHLKLGDTRNCYFVGMMYPEVSH